MSKCNFCISMDIKNRVDELGITDPDPEIQIIERRFGAAIVTRTFVKDDDGNGIWRSTDYGFHLSEDGFSLNFCPECGRKLTSKEPETNYEHIRSLEHYELATAILNIGDEPCKVCPRDREERCNEDCDNGIVEWLTAPYNPNDPVWKENQE